MVLNDSLKIKDLFKYPWNSKIGGLFWILFFLSLSFGIIAFSYNVKFKYYEYSIYSLLLIPIFAISWIINRALLIYYENKINIVFIFNIDYANEEVVNIYKNTLRILRDKLDTYNLSKKIRIIKKPLDLQRKGDRWAEKKVVGGMPCANLIIRGSPITVRGNSKFNLRFSYEFRHPDEPREKKGFYKKNLKKTIDKGFLGRHWMVLPQSVKNIELFAQNIFEVTFYILGLTICTNGQLDKGIKFFEIVRNEYQGARPLKKRSMGPMISVINDCLTIILILKIKDLMWNYEKNKKVIESYAQQILAIDKYNYHGLTTMAFVKEISGDRKRSKEYNERAETVAKKKYHTHKFNEIYYCFCENDYEEGLEILNELKQYDTINISIPLIIHFLYNKHKETNNHALLFECGFISFIWGDKKLGKKDLRSFLKNAKKNPDLDVLCGEAEKLIKS